MQEVLFTYFIRLGATSFLWEVLSRELDGVQALPLARQPQRSEAREGVEGVVPNLGGNGTPFLP